MIRARGGGRCRLKLFATFFVLVEVTLLCFLQTRLCTIRVLVQTTPAAHEKSLRDKILMERHTHGSRIFPLQLL